MIWPWSLGGTRCCCCCCFEPKEEKGQRVLNQNIRNCTPFDSHLSGKVIGLLSSLFYPFFFFVFLRLFTKRLWSYWYWYHTWGQLIARAWNGNLVNGKRVKPTSQFCALFHCSRWLLFPSKDLLYCSRGLNSTTDNFYVSPLYNTGNPRWFARNCYMLRKRDKITIGD